MRGAGSCSLDIPCRTRPGRIFPRRTPAAVGPDGCKQNARPEYACSGAGASRGRLGYFGPSQRLSISGAGSSAGSEPADSPLYLT